MSDKYFTFENFKYGLDARKSALNEVPGTLLQCVNGFINAGGEVEQRKSFAQIETSSHNDLPFPSDTFGLQDTAAGLVTFGSDASPSGTLPTGVTYQRLRPPHATVLPIMSSIVFSCNYLGKAFAIAKFNDGTSYAYYNGTIVPSSANGLVTLGEALSDLSSDLAGQVNGVIAGWLADANVTANSPSGPSGYGETTLNGSTLIMSPGGVHFAPVETATSAGGQLGAQLIDQNYGGVPAQAAKAAFTLNAGTTGTVTVTAPAKADGTGTAALTNGAVNFDTSLTQTAADIVAAINNYTFITGYTAVQNTTTITVFAPASFGNFTFNLTVTTTGDITTIGGTASNTFNLLLNPVGLNILKIGNHATTISGAITASSIGATGATGVIFLWDETNADGTTPVSTPSGILVSPIAHGSIGPPLRSAASVTFSKYLFPNTQAQGYFKCTAIDNGAGAQGNQPITYFSVTLELDNLL